MRTKSVVTLKLRLGAQWVMSSIWEKNEWRHKHKTIYISVKSFGFKVWFNDITYGIWEITRNLTDT